ncbi:hypothetical protein Mal15_66280 [Stieleria maiorica]|uniref:Uncharacterized protein n=2 Tax=Stieleria maiorica TaxID=2795974 RepID=A0A5B9MR39_9BACT|nr:hypothetical protein Mal15_66280 [Stieleria maiorica]
MQYIAQDIPQEQYLALGAIGFAIIGAVLFVTFAMMAGTLKLSIAWLGKASPSYLACFGWLLAITFVNCFLVVGTQSLFGETAVLLVTPLTWFVTLYMVSTAANCGLFRALGIWIVNSFLSAFGMAAIILVALIPFSILGAGLDVGGDRLQAEFEKVDAMIAELDEQQQTLDQIEVPEIVEVSFPSEEDAEPSQPSESIDADATDQKTPAASTIRIKPRSSVRPDRPTVTPRRAADGSMVNPFFEN